MGQIFPKDNSFNPSTHDLNGASSKGVDSSSTQSHKDGASDSFFIYSNQACRTETWEWRFPIDDIINVNLVSTVNEETILPLLLTSTGIIVPEHEIRHNISPWDEGVNKIKVVDSNSRMFEGHLLNRGENWVELNSNDRFRRVRDYSLLSLDKSKEPSHIKIDLRGWGDGMLQLSYLFDKCYWEPRYWALLDPKSDDTIAYLHLSAKIFNRTGEILKPDCINLVSGQINRPSSTLTNEHTLRSVSMASLPSDLMSSESQMDKGENIDVLKDYVVYEVEPRPLKTTTLIPLKKASNIPASKFYRYRVNHDGVEFGYHITPEFYLPAGNLEWYQLKGEHDDNCHSGIGAFLGSTQVKETHPGENTSLIIGKTRALVVELTQSETYENLESTTPTGSVTRSQKNVHFDLLLKNTTKTPASIEIIYDVGTQRVISSTPPWNLLPEEGLHWVYQVPSSDSISVTIDLVLS